MEFEAGCEAELKFCGFGGVNYSYGALIKSVSLVKKPSIPTYPQYPQYPQILQISTPQFPQIPNYGAQQFPQLNLNIPVLTPPVLTPPPVVIPTLPNLVLPTPPKINIPTIQPPTFQFPNVNFPVVNPPIYNPPVVNPPVIGLPNPLPPVVIFDLIGFFVEYRSLHCYHKEYNLQVGKEIEIEFSYNILTNLYVRDSALIVIWDNQEIGRVLPCDNGKTLRFKVNTSKGYHFLKFCTAGCATEKPHQISINNVAIYEKKCVGGWGKDIIVNGGFEQNSCGSSWCLWTASNIQPNNVPGWTPSPEIEVGKGTVYNSNLGSSWVSELDPNRNTCIKQKVPLKPGKALLTFDWAGRVGVSYESS